MNEKGKVIGEAIEIIRKTYKEVNRLKADVKELISEVDSTITSEQEYSYEPKTLNLKANHTVLYTNLDNADNAEMKNKIVFVIVCIFYDEGDIKRSSLKDQPEIWFALFNISNKKDNVSPWNFSNMFTNENMKYFKCEIRPDGSLYEYSQEKEIKEEVIEKWSGKFIGYPLADISDKNFLNDNVIRKLFSEVEL